MVYRSDDLWVTAIFSFFLVFMVFRSPEKWKIKSVSYGMGLMVGAVLWVVILILEQVIRGEV
jgi:hypothetical protein